MEEKTYAVLTAESVNAMAESSGIAPLPQEAASALGEDASYRIRQVVMLATQYMKHAKRRRMTTDDFNRAAKEMSLMPVCGHGSQDPVSFRNVKDSDVHCVEDPEVNLCDIALGNSVTKNIGHPSIKAHWLAVEGSVKIWTGGSSGAQGKVGKEMSKTHLNYYNCMTKALLSQKADAKKSALQDLKTNPNIVPMLPYIVNFVIKGIKNMSHDMGHLTTMLNVIRALLHNRSLYLMHKPYLSTMVAGIEFCVLEPLSGSISSSNDQWVLRDYAARLLADIVNRWSSPQNHLRYNTVKVLREVLQDPSRPFYSQYGAVMALVALGHKAIEEVILPHLATYWPHLQKAMEDVGTREKMVTQRDAFKVHGALRLAAEKTIRKNLKKFKEEADRIKDIREVTEMLDVNENETVVKQEYGSSSESGKRSPERSFGEMYKELYEYFGDSLAHCLPVMETHEVFKPQKQDERVNLGDANTGKSGEELLDNLMEQIRLEEKLEKERKERERIEKEEREKRERLKRAKEAILAKQREEEERAKRRKMEEDEQRRRHFDMMEAERQKKLDLMEAERQKKLDLMEAERQKKLDLMEADRQRKLDMLEAERKKKMLEEEEMRRREWEEQALEINRNRTKPQWQQEIEMRRAQLEEEMQYSRRMEAQKRQDDKVRQEEEKRLKKLRKVEEEQRMREAEEDEREGRALRRRKPVNYQEKDEDISDLFDDKQKPSGSRGPKPLPFPRLAPYMPPHSDISDVSDDDVKKLTGSPGDGVAVSKVIDPSKGLLKLKIKRSSGHSSTPPHPMSATPQHTPSSYHSPSMHSPLYSPVSGSERPPTNPSSSHHHYRSKSSSGSEKESKPKRGSSISSRHSRAGSIGFQDISDADEPTYDRLGISLPPMLYSPGGGESSGSDSNPHRKALKLKLKLTPKDSTSEGEH